MKFQGGLDARNGVKEVISDSLSHLNKVLLHLSQTSSSAFSLPNQLLYSP